VPCRQWSPVAALRKGGPADQPPAAGPARAAGRGAARAGGSGPSTGCPDGLVVARELHFGGRRRAIWCPSSARNRPAWQNNKGVMPCWLGIPALTARPKTPLMRPLVECLFGIGRTPRAGLEDLQQVFAERQAAREPASWWPFDVPTRSSLRRMGAGFLGAWRPLRAARPFCLDWLKQGAGAEQRPGLGGSLDDATGPAAPPAAGDLASRSAAALAAAD